MLDADAEDWLDKLDPDMDDEDDLLDNEDKLLMDVIDDSDVDELVDSVLWLSELTLETDEVLCVEKLDDDSNRDDRELLSKEVDEDPESLLIEDNDDKDLLDKLLKDDDDNELTDDDDNELTDDDEETLDDELDDKLLIDNELIEETLD